MVSKQPVETLLEPFLAYHACTHRLLLEPKIISGTVVANGILVTNPSPIASLMFNIELKWTETNLQQGLKFIYYLFKRNTMTNTTFTLLGS